MWRDPIVEEVRAHREALAAEYGHDLKALIAALRRKQGADGRRVVSFAAKRSAAKPARKKIG